MGHNEIPNERQFNKVWLFSSLNDYSIEYHIDNFITLVFANLAAVLKEQLLAQNKKERMPIPYRNLMRGVALRRKYIFSSNISKKP